MSVWLRSVHMLCGLFMLICGSATLRVTCHVEASSRDAVPGFSLPAVRSNCVSTHTSPTPGVAGLNSGGSVLSLP
jgi:hypothetical protein